MATVKFCKRCDNLLYPKEDADRKNLVYACRDCEYQEPAVNNIVYFKEIRHGVGSQDPTLYLDPILPRTKSVRCPDCKHGEAVFYEKLKSVEEGLTLFFGCCNPRCGNVWRG